MDNKLFNCITSDKHVKRTRQKDLKSAQSITRIKQKKMKRAKQNKKNDEKLSLRKWSQKYVRSI